MPAPDKAWSRTYEPHYSSGTCLWPPGWSGDLRNNRFQPESGFKNWDLSNFKHVKSMEMLAVEPELNESDLTLLEGVVWRPGYGQQTRGMALELLWRTDPDRTIVLLRRQLPDSPTGLAHRGLSVGGRSKHRSSGSGVDFKLGRPRSVLTKEEDRPEYLLVVQMHGRDEIVELVFDLFLVSNREIAAWVATTMPGSVASTGGTGPVDRTGQCS